MGNLTDSGPGAPHRRGRKGAERTRGWGLLGGWEHRGWGISKTLYKFLAHSYTFERNAANCPCHSAVTNFSIFIIRIVCSIHSALMCASNKLHASIVSPPFPASWPSPCAASWPSPASSTTDAVEAPSSFSEVAAASFFICHMRTRRLSDTAATRQTAARVDRVAQRGIMVQSLRRCCAATDDPRGFSRPRLSVAAPLRSGAH